MHKGQQTRAIILEAALGLARTWAWRVVHRRAGRGDGHEQVRRVRPLRLARELHSPWSASTTPNSRKRSSSRRSASRAACRACALFERWVRRVTVEIDSGCIYISGAVEFDDRPGPVRDALVSMVARPGSRRRRPSAGWRKAIWLPDTDVEQILFELHGLILSLHHDARFMRNPGAFERPGKGFERMLRPMPRRPGQQVGRTGIVKTRPGGVPFPTLFEPSLESRPCLQYTCPARHAVRHARGAERRRRAEDAAWPMPTSTPTPSTRCWKKAASSPPR